jgi:putative ATPase
MYQPLAEILRPERLDDVIGQKHLVGRDKPLELLSRNTPQSFILWGPPGVGKTTIANILIKTWKLESVKLSAVLSGIKEIRDALDRADSNVNGLFGQPLVLFIDEIHRFNKAQQDAFLHHLEDGRIILIGATTENPSFELNNALLSRLQVYVLEPLTRDDLSQVLDKAQAKISQPLQLTDKAREIVLDLADGDARRLLNILEALISYKLPLIDEVKLKQILPNSLKRFDKGGEDFYNQISALHKSVRGSDPDAAIYWLARMLNGGADPLYIARRVLRMAWEDIGLADTDASTIAINALQTYERLGSPEGELALASAVIYLATTPKSNSTELAYNKVKGFVAKDISRQVPIHLRNAPTKLMAELGYGKEYKYAHNYPHHYVANENYWPDNMPKQNFYTPTQNGTEVAITERLNFLRELDKQQQNNQSDK